MEVLLCFGKRGCQRLSGKKGCPQWKGGAKGGAYIETGEGGVYSRVVNWLSLWPILNAAAFFKQTAPKTSALLEKLIDRQRLCRKSIDETFSNNGCLVYVVGSAENGAQFVQAEGRSKGKETSKPERNTE